MGIPLISRSLRKKMKFSIENFFSKCDQILWKLLVWSYLLKKSLMENFIFCAVRIPNKTLISNFTAMEDNHTHSISTVFKNFFSNLAESLLTKLPNPPDKYNLESVINYYSSFTIANDFCLKKTSENKVLKIISKY